MSLDLDKVKKAAGWAGRNHAFLGWLLFTASTIGMTYFGCKPLPNVAPPPAIVEATDDPVIVVEDGERPFAAADVPDGAKVVHTGWKRDPDAVAAVVGGLPQPRFMLTPAGMQADPLPDHVYLWKAYAKLGYSLPGKNQGQVGSCVSFGTNTAIERTSAYDIAFNGAAFEFKRLAEEVTYAGSRVDIGHGEIRGDGSVGAWAAKFVRDFGVVSREPHGNYDLSEYSERRCREWGSRGIPAEVKALTRDHPVKSITQVKTWEEGKRALAQGYGIAVCSNRGFSQNRNQNGVAQPSGVWNHCMCLDGYHVENGKEYGHIDNSWGDFYFRGPIGWGEPPASGFWAESRVVEGMLRQDDSWAFSAFAGFPAKKILPDWYADRSPSRRRGQFTAPFAMGL